MIPCSLLCFSSPQWSSESILVFKKQSMPNLKHNKVHSATTQKAPEDKRKDIKQRCPANRARGEVFYFRKKKYEKKKKCSPVCNKDERPLCEESGGGWS